LLIFAEMAAKSFTDMIGNRVTISYPPTRIISLVPSQTELLFDLGLREEVVGITKFCIHPEEWFHAKKRVGGTKTLHFDIIRDLNPDLIIANKEENTREQIEELAAIFPVWTSDIKTIDDALSMITKVGDLTGRKEQAGKLVSEIRTGFQGLLQVESGNKKVAYYIWRNPWMIAGGDTFISDMLKACGWENVFSGIDRYPEITLDLLKEMQPELVLLSSEPYPFKEGHIEEIKIALPATKVLLADGEMFSWYGSRMKLAPEYMKGLL
jgi:ABC-type Fe3+-hydroxamate transport system substrate-binding protein